MILSEGAFLKRIGFTLIELLVVVAIIVILAGLLFPVFSMARQKTRLTYCINNMKQIWTAVMMYSEDYNDRVPYVEDPWFYPLADRQDLVKGDPTNRQLNPHSLINVMMPYARSVDIWKCPSAVIGYPGSSAKDWKQTYFFGAANFMPPSLPWSFQDTVNLRLAEAQDNYYSKFAYEYFDGRPIRLTVNNFTMTKDSSRAEHSSLFNRPVIQCAPIQLSTTGKAYSGFFNGVPVDMKMPHSFKGYPVKVVIHTIGEEGRVRIESFVTQSTKLGIPNYGWSITGSSGW